MYVGERVDAIERIEEEIRDLDRMIEEAQARTLVGTGTAFVTFKKRSFAADFVRDYRDPRVSNKSWGSPTIGERPTDLCFNASMWTVGMATRPEDVCWRNLRYTRFQSWVLTIFGFIGLFVALSFVVTPLFFVQVFSPLCSNPEPRYHLFLWPVPSPLPEPLNPHTLSPFPRSFSRSRRSQSRVPKKRMMPSRIEDRHTSVTGPDLTLSAARIGSSSRSSPPSSS